MKQVGMKRWAFAFGIMGLSLAAAACGGGEGGGEGPIVPPPPAPAEYADKHMPAGWWTDPKIVEEGRELYIGRALSNLRNGGAGPQSQ